MTEPLIQFSPLRFWAGFCAQLLCDTCNMYDMNLTSLHLCCRLAVFDSLFPITGLLDTLMKLLMLPVFCLHIHSAIQIQHCNLKNQYQADGTMLNWLSHLLNLG